MWGFGCVNLKKELKMITISEISPVLWMFTTLDESCEDGAAFPFVVLPFFIFFLLLMQPKVMLPVYFRVFFAILYYY